MVHLVSAMVHVASALADVVSALAHVISALADFISAMVRVVWAMVRVVWAMVRVVWAMVRLVSALVHLVSAMAHLVSAAVDLVSAGMRPTRAMFCLAGAPFPFPCTGSPVLAGREALVGDWRRDGQPSPPLGRRHRTVTGLGCYLGSAESVLDCTAGLMTFSPIVMRRHIGNPHLRFGIRQYCGCCGARPGALSRNCYNCERAWPGVRVRIVWQLPMLLGTTVLVVYAAIAAAAR